MFNQHFGLESAVLAGSKTMTRRTATKEDIQRIYTYDLFGDNVFRLAKDLNGKIYHVAKAKYKRGETVAILQSYETVYKWMRRFDPSPLTAIDFKTEHENSRGWTNKMYVSPKCMPFGIEITDIKAERLQDITEADIMREGVSHALCSAYNPETGEEGDYCFYRYTVKGDAVNIKCSVYTNARDAFRDLIIGVSGRKTWEANCWQFAYSFKKVNINPYFNRFYELESCLPVSNLKPSPESKVPSFAI